MPKTWLSYTGSNVKTDTGNVETVKYVNNMALSPEKKIYARDSQVLHEKEALHGIPCKREIGTAK